MGLNYGFNSFNTFSTLFTVVFIVILIVFVLNAFNALAQWNQNNHSPRLTVFAAVTSKRIDVSHHTHSNAGNAGVHHSSTTWYYVTFQVESGDRMEFTVSGPEYGMLSEGDEGSLSFQGTRFLSFERIPSDAAMSRAGK